MQDFICDLPIIGDFMAQRPKVAVVRLSGVLADHGMRKGGLSYAKYADLIEQAFAVKGVREVALVINSPGRRARAGFTAVRCHPPMRIGKENAGHGFC